MEDFSLEISPIANYKWLQRI